MVKLIKLSFLSIVAVAAAAPAAELPRAVGQWHLDGNAEDSSGRGHHGLISDAAFVPRGDGQALHLDGETGAVRIAAHAELNVGRAGAVEMWCRPKSRHGALFSWGQDNERGNRRFVVVFDTRQEWGEPGGELRLWAGGGRRYQTYSSELPDLPLERWTHVVVSIDGSSLVFYYDGAPVMEVALPFDMDLTDQPLVIGQYEWSGDDLFRGMIDEVALYDQPLSGQQVLELYRQKCASFDHDQTLLSRPALELHVQSEAGRIAVRVRTAKMGAMPVGTTVRAELSGANVSASAPIDPTARPTLLSVDTAALPAGTYELQCAVVGPDGATVGQPSQERVTWPGRDPAFANVRVLNNLVWELLSERPGDVSGELRYTFTQPKRRWVYLRAAGRDFDVTVNGIKAALPEAMLFLPPGEHTLVLRPRGSGRVESLIVRSIPHIIFDSMIPHPYVASAIPFDEDFIRRYIVPHVNTFTVVSSKSKPRPQQPLFHEIHASGRHILGHCLVPREIEDEPITAGGAADFIANTWGMTHPELNGSIADEFGVSRSHCAVYAQAWRRLRADPRFAERQYLPYVGRLYTGQAGRELVQALVDTGSAFAFKRYLRCPATEQAAYDFAWRGLIHFAQRYRTLCPGSIESMIVCFGYFCAPNEFLNVVPQVNYKTFLDMQFHMVATEPEFWATRGLHNYLVHYADEETSRWVVHLFRHYGIEGSALPAATDPFDSSTLLADGDFENHSRHWQLKPAAPDSMDVIDEIHLGWLQGRYPYTPRGDSALRMVRSASRPNVAAQTIRNLQPGRLYAARMISAVHGDMTSQEPHVLRFNIQGAQVIPDKSFTQVFHNSYAHSYGDYNTDNHAWMTYHWMLFRANTAQAELTISDWADENQPGGPIGEPLILNYVQVHPYYNEP